MSKTPTLIRPDKDSVTQFDPYYHLTEEEFNRILDAYAKHFQGQCKRIENVDDWMTYDVTDCCGIGPITTEKYCPQCGKKINNPLTETE
jgi:hypothetical protein